MGNKSTMTLYLDLILMEVLMEMKSEIHQIWTTLSKKHGKQAHECCLELNKYINLNFGHFCSEWVSLQ